MKIDLKIILPYIAILISLGMTWGMWSERLEAVEAKADSVNSNATRYSSHKRKKLCGWNLI